MKIRRPADHDTSANRDPRGPKWDYPDPYFALECGHRTCREVAIIYDCFAPDGVSVFCEQCGKWSSRLIKHRPVPLPDVPLF